MRTIFVLSTTMMVFRRTCPFPSRTVVAFRTMGCSCPIAGRIERDVASVAAKRTTEITNRDFLGMEILLEFVDEKPHSRAASYRRPSFLATEADARTDLVSITSPLRRTARRKLMVCVLSLAGLDFRRIPAEEGIMPTTRRTFL